MIELKQYATQSGLKVALVKEGRKWIQVLTMDGKLTVRKVPKTEDRYMCELTHKRKPYPMSRALRTFRRFGRTHGINKRAKLFLREAQGGN
jgi:hypothetical protein